ncbi:MAG: hypothetical protein ACYDCJ_07540 [Gammaproteobacteria bacterium]
MSGLHRCMDGSSLSINVPARLDRLCWSQFNTLLKFKMKGCE